MCWQLFLIINMYVFMLNYSGARNGKYVHLYIYTYISYLVEWGQLHHAFIQHSYNTRLD